MCTSTKPPGYRPGIDAIGYPYIYAIVSMLYVTVCYCVLLYVTVCYCVYSTSYPVTHLSVITTLVS